MEPTGKRVKPGYDAHKERQALRAPSSTILTMPKHFRHAAVRRRAHQRH